MRPMAERPDPRRSSCGLPTTHADLIGTIGPTGAGARLLQAGLQFVFDSAGEVYVTGLEPRTLPYSPV